ncbi:FAD-dependent oxidoreductase [Myxococcus stipitatus]|uniref:FAD/NAD(P)-binding protein n=1 Tax=Myxococcus stipitatus TaxID=83455 RepID=UPI001F1B82B1|nr:FAD/NAD(P)-binding protein [Myxococcus stipitatus]MCE9672223.1 FAD-dependent oxidoreductase [Myxococcus stipitatus]
MRAWNAGDVAIIGGGASGTLLAIHLLRHARAPLRVLLVERGEQVGRGLAYSTKNPCHLLNVPASRMGAFTDDPEHFLRWLRRHAPDTAPGAFVPREHFGRYLQELLRETADTAPAGARLEVLRADVVAAREEPRGVRLTLADGEERLARFAVLVPGNAPPADLRVPDGGLYDGPRYVRSPWAEGALEHIAARDAVLFIGTGLTMVDTVLSLRARGHEGPLHALSRHGLLPHRHLETPVVPASREVMRALREEGLDPTAPGDGGAASVRLRPLVRLLRREAREAARRGADWRAVVDALRPVSIPLWQGLPLPERRRFLRHLRACWEVHRHRMAPGVADEVERLRDAGRLRLHAGRVRGFQWDGEDVVVTLQPRGAGGRESRLRVRHVVNCTGPESSMGARAHPLLRDLVDAGLARPDALGLGLDTQGPGALVDAQGQPSRRLFTLGPTRRGDLWETTAIPEIRAQARELAERLVKQLATTTPRRSAG